MENIQIDEKHVMSTVEIQDRTEAIGHLKNQEDHQETVCEALSRHPKTVIWLVFAIWILVICSFDNQVGGVVIGIPQFRKDFGFAFDGNYVLPAKWQSAFSGGPTASTILGSIGAGYIGDRIGRKWMYAITFVVVLVGITVESEYSRI